MKKLTKLAALLMALVMVVSLAACSKKTDSTTEPTTAPVSSTDKKDDTTTSTADTKTEDTPSADVPTVDEIKTAVYATSTFGQKFSPFFATTAYDTEVVDMIVNGLLAYDRGGNMILDGMNGKDIAYNGTTYHYDSPANCEVVINADGTVDYKLTMRDDITFSDGVKADIDDVIFGIYVFSDPTYDGSSTLYAQPIIGMDEYYHSMSYLYKLLINAGRDNTDFTFFTEDTQKAFWADVDAAGEKFAQEIVDYCVATYLDMAPDYIGASAEDVTADPALQVKLGMFMWGFDSAWFEGATAADYWAGIEAAYNGDLETASDTESAGTSLWDFMPDFNKYTEVITTADSVKSISGIERTGDYSLTVHMAEYDATAIYNMGFSIVPLHYYGDESLYDYANNSFGFPKGDLSIVKAKTSAPMGAGPYAFESYNNGVVTLKANEYYFLGKPVIDTILFQESVDSDYVPGINTGSFDIAVPSISEDTLNAIKDANSNGELVGDTITTYLVDYRGYGYLGINANLVKVGENSGSEESKNLRKALMTLYSVYRDTVINSYYGDRASVIQYPISNTSWAAPQPTDAGYRLAYSTDVDGNPIYTEGMNDESKYEAALTAAIGFLKAAGYTWDNATSTFTAAPAGASMTYEVMIPGAGQQDHPAYGIAVAASEALAKVGITLQVNDVGTSTWNNALESNTAEMWAAAWQASLDPDMYQVYHSSNANGLNTNSNHYQIMDDSLDALIIAGRTSADSDFRKATYKEAMEVILDWGVELPLYQRKDCTTVSSIRINTATMPGDMTPFCGWNAEVDKLDVQ